MKERLNVHYDEEGDLLEILMGDITDCYYEEIDNGIFERIDEKTGKIKGFSIFSFRKRMKDKKDVNVLLPVNVQVVS